MMVTNEMMCMYKHALNALFLYTYTKKFIHDNFILYIKILLAGLFYFENLMVCVSVEFEEDGGRFAFT